MNILSAESVPTGEIIYADRVCAEVFQKVDDADRLIANIIEKTDAQCTCEKFDAVYINVDAYGKIVSK